MYLCAVDGCPKHAWSVAGGIALDTCWRHAGAETRSIVRAMLVHWAGAGCPCGCASRGR